MEPRTHPTSRAPLRRAILRMCAAYMSLGALWVFFSDTALQRLGSELVANPAVHIAKGLAFIIVTTLLLFLMFRHVRTLTEQTRMKEIDERYRALFDRSLDGVFLADLQGRFLDANQAALDLLGYERDEIDSLDYRSLIVPEQLPRALTGLQEVIRTGRQTQTSQFTLRRKDGGLVEVESKSSLVYADGRPYAVQGVVRDVTQRAQAETALRESEQRFRQMAESIGEVFWLAAPDLQTVFYMSPAFERIWGRPCAELYERPLLWLEAIHSEDAPSVLRALRGLARGESFDVEFRIRRPDGTERWINDRGYPVRSEDGSVLLATGVATDVTERKDAERELSLAAKVFDQSREGIMICDPDNRIISVNDAFTTITGYEEVEVLGASPKLLQSGRQDASFYAELWRSLEERGHWQGEVWNRRKNGEIYPEWLAITEVRNLAGEVTHRVGIFSDITERKQSEERIRHLAEHDLLTELPNRLLLTDRVEMAIAQAARHDAHAALLFLDLDRFKLVNDSIGHDVGDELLKEVAERLRTALRRADTVSRHGGDEFLVLLHEVANADAAARIATKLLAEVARPYHIGDHELALSASVGIALFPENGSDMTTLLRNADTAMYAAKEAGRNRYRFFSAEMNAQAVERLELERDLRFAVDREELSLVYQPQVELTTGRVTGVEALVRWNHPVLGPVSPGRFIPVAEESGAILEIGEWVMRTACRQMAEWRERGILDAPIAVNVSAVQFQQLDFVDTVSRVLRESGLAPGEVELEVTETAVMSGAESMIGKLAELKGRGMRLAIDDFGTGYSSLSYLRRFPIHRLKIDSSFVHDLPGDRDAAAIARAVVGMGNSLSLNVVAEGVETPEQAELLRAIHCRDAQGYLFCRPLVAKDLEQWLSTRPPAPISGWNA